MKKFKVLTLGVLSLLAATALTVGCEKPKQREEVVNPAIEGKLIKIADIRDATSGTNAAFFYGTRAEGQKVDESGPKKLAVDATAKKIVGSIADADQKKQVEEHLKSGLITFVVQPKLLKIYKVLSTDEALNEAANVLTLSQVKKEKIEAVNALKNTKVFNDFDEEVADESPYGLVEIASVEIEKVGVLDNQKTKYYNEKMSFLNVDERDLEVSTHILLKAPASK